MADEITYKLRSVAEAKTYFSPTTQYSLECGLVCRYETDVPYPGVFDFEEETGAITISSDDKSLSGSSMNI